VHAVMQRWSAAKRAATEKRQAPKPPAETRAPVRPASGREPNSDLLTSDRSGFWAGIAEIGAASIGCAKDVSWRPRVGDGIGRILE
jgi:hypothetical protein